MTPGVEEGFPFFIKAHKDHDMRSIITFTSVDVISDDVALLDLIIFFELASGLVRVKDLKGSFVLTDIAGRRSTNLSSFTYPYIGIFRDHSEPL